MAENNYFPQAMCPGGFQPPNATVPSSIPPVTDVKPVIGTQNVHSVIQTQTPHSDVVKPSSPNLVNMTDRGAVNSSSTPGPPMSSQPYTNIRGMSPEYMAMVQPPLPPILPPLNMRFPPVPSKVGVSLQSVMDKNGISSMVQASSSSGLGAIGTGLGGPVSEGKKSTKSNTGKGKTFPVSQAAVSMSSAHHGAPNSYSLSQPTTPQGSGVVKEKPYKCDCGKSFTQRGGLKQHMRLHTGEKPFKCKECGKAFSQHAGLNQHSRVHTGERPYPCHLCTAAFKQRSGLNQHIRTHTGEKPYDCPVCGKAFAQKSGLIQHNRMHTGEKPFMCSICGQHFSQPSSVKHHTKVHHPDVADPSPKRTQDVPILWPSGGDFPPGFGLHAMVPSSVIPPPDGMGVPGSASDTNPEGMDSIGPDTGGNTLSNSGKTMGKSGTSGDKVTGPCLSQPNLTGINPKCIGIMPPPMPPGLPPFNLRLPPALYNNKDCAPLQPVPGKNGIFNPSWVAGDPRMMAVTSMQGPALNSLLGSKNMVAAAGSSNFPVSQAMSSKMNISPHGMNSAMFSQVSPTNACLKDRPFKCTQQDCDKAFTQKAGLEQHVRLHTGERPYSCTECGKEFTQQAGLNQHVRVHTGERPYLCAVCSTSFKQKSGLVQHMRRHTGERPFACTVCGKAFVQKSGLIQHSRMHTGEKPFACHVCGQHFSQPGNVKHHIKIHHPDLAIPCTPSPDISDSPQEVQFCAANDCT